MEASFTCIRLKAMRRFLLPCVTRAAVSRTIGYRRCSIRFSPRRPTARGLVYQLAMALSRGTADRSKFRVCRMNTQNLWFGFRYLQIDRGEKICPGKIARANEDIPRIRKNLKAR